MLVTDLITFGRLFQSVGEDTVKLQSPSMHRAFIARLNRSTQEIAIKEKIERHFMRFIIQYLTYCTLPCLFGQLTMLHIFRSFRGTVIKTPCKIILPL